MDSKTIISSFISDVRPDNFLSVNTPKAPKNAIQQKRILLDGEFASTADYITGGEELCLLPTKDKNPLLHHLPKLKVIYEDEHLAVIDKPAGIVVHGNKALTVQNCLRKSIQTSKLPDALHAPLAVHRLDYPTSGALLVAKTKSSCTLLNKRFVSRNIRKTYYAVLVAELNDKTILYDDPIDHKEAMTELTVLQQIDSPRFEKLNLVRLNPVSGRKHQLRIHCHALGNPILGDQLYYHEKFKHQGKGLYLHATQLKFNHPFHQNDLTISSPLPKKFTKLFPTFQSS